ncbi:hypothetical protein HMPREF9440_00258 [Sutterella parvirubra YIT 11816]|uniref:Uncharacterized protein n=1 Tax=Sutterella parvirubra YIT 11816 TaxID=762967 RepID=H3KC08_9BURK|nr:hypothetical protein HMPREF9440_00258 [Sutterella parvirubra YIT 11816]
MCLPFKKESSARKFGRASKPGWSPVGPEAGSEVFRPSVTAMRRFRKDPPGRLTALRVDPGAARACPLRRILTDNHSHL